MELKKTEDQEFVLRLSEQETRVVVACLREVFANIDRREFPLRLGASFEDVSLTSRTLRELLEREGFEE